MMKLTVFTDGASRGNPGPASYGFTVADEVGRLIHEEGEYIGYTTNNVAEYTAVLKAFEFIKSKFFDSIPLEIALFADSNLVAQQLAGKFKIKSEHLRVLIQQIKILEQELGQVTFTHIPREKNTQADKLANQALDNR